MENSLRLQGKSVVHIKFHPSSILLFWCFVHRIIFCYVNLYFLIFKNKTKDKILKMKIITNICMHMYTIYFNHIFPSSLPLPDGPHLLATFPTVSGSHVDRACLTLLWSQKWPEHWNGRCTSPPGYPSWGTEPRASILDKHTAAYWTFSPTPALFLHLAGAWNTAVTQHLP